MAVKGSRPRSDREAVYRPTTRFVEIETEQQQAMLSIHRMRGLAVRQRTLMANMIRNVQRIMRHVVRGNIQDMHRSPSGAKVQKREIESWIYEFGNTPQTG